LRIRAVEEIEFTQNIQGVCCCRGTSKAWLLCQRRRRRRVRPEKIYSGIDWPLLLIGAMVARRAVGGLDDRSSDRSENARPAPVYSSRNSFILPILHLAVMIGKGGLPQY
jgi:hypothetical protein